MAPSPMCILESQNHPCARGSLDKRAHYTGEGFLPCGNGSSHVQMGDLFIWVLAYKCSLATSATGGMVCSEVRILLCVRSHSPQIELRIAANACEMSVINSPFITARWPISVARENARQGPAPASLSSQPKILGLHHISSERSNKRSLAIFTHREVHHRSITSHYC
jgi:hypothetical protein